MTVSTRLAMTTDIPSWLELLPEVQELFGPMPSFEHSVARAVDRGTALVATDIADAADITEVVGGALLSGHGQPHHIHWLAVRRSCRRRGAAAALLSAILERWPTGDIEVVTFTCGTPGGAPARNLYERFGFVCTGSTDPAPDGSPRDLYLLHRP